MKYEPQFTVPTSVNLCGVICSDGIELMGLASTRTAGDEVDLVLLYIPGQFDNAYQQRKNHSLLCVTNATGFGCVLANTRGQDYYGYQRKYASQADTDSYTWELLGSTFEQVRDAHYDLDAWIDFITRTAPNADIVLAGHSHGAIKIANYMCEKPTSNQIRGIVLLSPSDDIGSQRHKLDIRYDEALDLATRLIEDRKPDALMPNWAFAAPMSARTYSEAFGTNSPLTTFAYYDPSTSPLSQEAVGWTQPSLVVFGSDDAATGVMTSDGASEVARSLLSGSQRCDTFIVPNANHHYRGVENLVAQTVVDWISDAVRA